MLQLMRRLLIFLLFWVLLAARAHASILVLGSPQNDLVVQLKKDGFQLVFADSPEHLMKLAHRGDVLLVLASSENRLTPINQQFYHWASSKKLRCYIEIPEQLPGKWTYGEPFRANLERGVISSGFFGKALPEMSILGLNDLYIQPIHSPNALVSFAKVAGFDKADYGLTGVEAHALLSQKDNVLVAAAYMSNFKNARYGPSASWQLFWESICSWLLNTEIHLSAWESDPRPAYSASEALPPDARITAILHGAAWIYRGNFLVHPSWREVVLKYQGDGLNPFGPPVGADKLAGDGCAGVLEGHASRIYQDGSQQYRYWMRCDVQGEVAFLLASAGKQLQNRNYLQTSGHLLDYMFYTAPFRQGLRAKKGSPVYGLLGWSETHPYVFYGDDNARAVLGAIGASAMLDDDRWASFIADNILANFRTSSQEGFEGGRLEEEDILKNGWRFYQSRSYINPHPHFESWMWACYLWLYHQTGYAPLLEKTKRAMAITMNHYPDKWKWTNGIQQERARMILPLAWLVRVDDTPEHRAWLDRVVTDLLKKQQPGGAIQEELGTPGLGLCEEVKSNSEYGAHEAPLIAKNGDPVADMLYTCNFAYFALNEAAHATGNNSYFEAVARLSDFLTRIQVKSSAHPDLDGAWFRAFDYNRWDYWASNADNGWGAWCTLTGWIQSWIVSTHYFVENKKSYWETTEHLAVKKYADQYIKEELVQ